MRRRYVDGMPDPLAVDWLDLVEENARAQSSVMTCRRESRGRLVIEAKAWVNKRLERMRKKAAVMDAAVE